MLLAARLTAPAFAADSPIAKAARSDDLATVKQPFGSRANVNLPATDGSTALTFGPRTTPTRDGEGAHRGARKRERREQVRRHAADSGEPHGRRCDRQGASDGGAEVSLAHPDGETPLMAAAQAGNVEAVELLLASGAKPNAQERFRQETALMWPPQRATRPWSTHC